MKPEDVKVTSTEQVQDKVPDVTALGLNISLPLYTVWFRRGNRAPEAKNFQLSGNLRNAIDKSRLYCEQMGFRFCGTYPFLSDLDRELKARQDGTFLSEAI
jgi:hypothetical protein